MIIVSSADRDAEAWDCEWMSLCRSDRDSLLACCRAATPVHTHIGILISSACASVLGKVLSTVLNNDRFPETHGLCVRKRRKGGEESGDKDDYEALRMPVRSLCATKLCSLIPLFLESRDTR